jgi:hypothetical protein
MEGNSKLEEFYVIDYYTVCSNFKGESLETNFIKIINLIQLKILENSFIYVETLHLLE